MLTTVTCSACGAAVQVSAPIPFGKKLRCCHCQAVFSPTASGFADAKTAQAIPKAPPEPPPPLRSRGYAEWKIKGRPRQRARDPEDRELEVDDWDYRSGKSPNRSSNGLILGLSLGAGALVLILVGVVLMLVLRKGSEADPGPCPVPDPAPGIGKLQGTWDLQNAAIPERITIDADTITTAFGLNGLEQRYRMIDDRTMELDFHKFPPNQRPAQNFDTKVRYTIVSVMRDELVYVDNVGQQKKYRRAQ